MLTLSCERENQRMSMRLHLCAKQRESVCERKGVNRNQKMSMRIHICTKQRECVCEKKGVRENQRISMRIDLEILSFFDFIIATRTIVSESVSM